MEKIQCGITVHDPHELDTELTDIDKNHKVLECIVIIKIKHAKTEPVI